MPARPQLRIVPPQKQAVSEIELTIKEYLLAKRQEEKSAGTLEKYGLRLGQFVAWMDKRGVYHLESISKLLLREWGASLPTDWEPSTRRHALTIIKTFLNWCRREGLIDEQPAAALRLPKVKLRIQRTLSAEEVRKLLDTCNDSLFGLRDAAIVSLMVDSGLRATEVCRLKVSDLVFDFPMGDDLVNFIPVIGKGGHQKPVYFGHDTAARLRVWLKVRTAKPGVENVFVSLGGNTPLCALTRSGLGNLLQDLGNRANVPGVSPHSLRRTFAMLLDEAGATTRQIQALGRWSDIRMVERYTQDIKTAKVYKSPADRLRKAQTPK